MQDDNLKMPLVSVIVITYNSEKYVNETLESIKEQTYKNIELIITDDCSTDKTVEICEEWINNNNERFSNTLIIKSEINTGTAANCNRGLKASKGEWIKYIAGDDILLPNCITDNMNFVLSNNNIDILFSKGYTINHKGIIIGKAGCDVKKMQMDSKKQYKMLLKYPYLFTVSYFVRTELLMNIGGYNENYPLLEDYPLWLKLTKNGIKLYYFDVVTVKYRIHSESVMSETVNRKSNNIKNKYNQSLLIFFNDGFSKELLKNKMFISYFLNYIHKKIIINEMQNKIIQARLFYFIGLLYIPTTINKIKSILISKYKRVIYNND